MSNQLLSSFQPTFIAELYNVIIHDMHFKMHWRVVPDACIHDAEISIKASITQSHDYYPIMYRLQALLEKQHVIECKFTTHYLRQFTQVDTLSNQPRDLLTYEVDITHIHWLAVNAMRLSIDQFISRFMRLQAA